MAIFRDAKRVHVEMLQPGLQVFDTAADFIGTAKAIEQHYAAGTALGSAAPLVGAALGAIPVVGPVIGAAFTAQQREASQDFAQQGQQFIENLQKFVQEARVAPSSTTFSPASPTPFPTFGPVSQAPPPTFGVDSPTSLEALIAQIRGRSISGLQRLQFPSFSNSLARLTMNRKRVRRTWSWGVMT